MKSTETYSVSQDVTEEVSMHSLVVYESLFGNTKQVARVVAEALDTLGTSRAVRVDALTGADLDDVELLLVGVPTHAWGLPRRRTWTRKPPDPQPRVLAREWLQHLGDGHGRPCAAFATRLDQPRVVTGSAAGGLARRLRRRGWTPAIAPASFVVPSMAGPISPEELERARRWAESVGRAAQALLPTERLGPLVVPIDGER